MIKLEFITTTELATDRGVSRQAILLAVKRGKLKPAAQLANGMYLFEPPAPEAVQVTA